MNYLHTNTPRILCCRCSHCLEYTSPMTLRLTDKHLQFLMPGSLIFQGPAPMSGSLCNFVPRSLPTPPAQHLSNCCIYWLEVCPSLPTPHLRAELIQELVSVSTSLTQCLQGCPQWMFAVFKQNLMRPEFRNQKFLSIIYVVKCPNKDVLTESAWCYVIFFYDFQYLHQINSVT